MVIFSQDRERFIVAGVGTFISIVEMEDENGKRSYGLFADGMSDNTKDTTIFLGEFSKESRALEVLKALGTGVEKRAVMNVPQDSDISSGDFSDKLRQQPLEENQTPRKNRRED